MEKPKYIHKPFSQQAYENIYNVTNDFKSDMGTYKLSFGLDNTINNEHLNNQQIKHLNFTHSSVFMILIPDQE